MTLCKAALLALSVMAAAPASQRLAAFTGPCMSQEAVSGRRSDSKRRPLVIVLTSDMVQNRQGVMTPYPFAF